MVEIMKRLKVDNILFDIILDYYFQKFTKNFL